MTIKDRSQVEAENCWNVNAFYPTFTDWEKAFQIASSGDRNQRWSDFNKWKGKLNTPENLKQALESYFAISRELSKIYTYSHLRHDEDISNDQFKAANAQSLSLYHEFAQASSWVEPELLSYDEKTLENLVQSPLLKNYKFYLEKIIRLKKHTLSADKEELLALAAKALQTPRKTFSALNDADFKFGNVLDSKGQERPLTHASYGLYLRDHDRTLRKNTFIAMHQTFGNYENTLTELINGQVQSHWFNAQARHFASSLEAALLPKNIDTEVYHALIQAVDKGLGALHRYIKLREKILNTGPLHLYDMHVPLTSEIEIRIPYEEAEELIIESVAPLGNEYQDLLRDGLKKHKWVDRYENKNKRSGAYSSGCYDSMPYILMNYKDILRDVFTLAHEAGHSMHSLLSHKNQPYHYGDYPIFLAEVASTFNEELLMKLLLKRYTKKEEQIYLINQKIEDIRATFFRQTMFAEFELLIHTLAEQNVPLTPKLLKKEFRKLNSKYFGPSVVIDTEAEIEWARIPHFYYNFYVYQYATGISAALALSDRVLNGGDKEREEYLSFLKGGNSKYPIDMLKMAGVDMRSPQPVEATIKRFNDLVSQLEQLLV